MTLWSADQAVAATGGRFTRHWTASGVSIDTRSIAKGDLFVALQDVRDGHEFVAQALEKGAAAALVSKVPDGVSPDAPLLIVQDTLQALQAMATHRRSAVDAKIIGVTGSVGKTSTKEMLRVALAGQARVHAAERSFNNHWGVPLTLARMPLDTQVAVIEMGMNAPGEIAALTRLARPHVALITEVSQAHMAGFKALSGIAKAKAEIFEGLEQGGFAILNRDTRMYPRLLRAAKKHGAQPVRFGMAGRPEFALSRTTSNDGGIKVLARKGRKKITFTLANPGKHFAMNALGALACVDAAGFDLDRAARDIAAWAPPKGRGDRHDIMLPGGPLVLIDDSYNANPASMKAALSALAATPAKRRVAILGDMLELGETSDQAHTQIATQAEAIDIVHLVGPAMALSSPTFANRGEVVQTTPEILRKIAELLHPGDVVMVKGSLGIGLGALVDAIKKLGKTA